MGDVFINLFHTESACETTSILGGEALVHRCELCVCVCCASPHLPHLSPLMQTHAYSFTHGPLCKLYRQCSVNNQQSLVTHIIGNTMLCRYTNGT